MTASAARALPILWLITGHQLPICSVNTRQAMAGGACTVTVFGTVFEPR